MATLQFTPSKDNTLIEVPLGNSNGRGELFAGRVRFNQDNSIRRAVMAFDLSSIPSGATVTDANLAMTVSRARGGSAGLTLHRLGADWGEGTSSGGGRGSGAVGQDATWMQRLPGTAWTNAGGDFNGSASATTSVGGPGNYTWTSPGMVSDVQSWLANSAANFGWLLRGDESTGGTVKRFHSKDTGGNPPLLTVTFTEPANLTLNIAADTISEAAGAGATTATVTRTGSTSSALVVSLVSSDTSEANVPASVTIPAGQTSSPAFNLDAVDDNLVDGTQSVTVTASASGLPNATDNLDVTDDDVATLTLTIAAEAISEDGGTTAATVSRNTSTSSALVVNLTSSDTSEATVPPTVTIAAGQTTSPAFTITAVDDFVVDGTQTVTVTASSGGFVDGADDVDVTDDDVLPVATGQNVNGEDNSNRSRVLNLTVQFDQAVTVGGPTLLKLFNHTTGQQIDLSAATLENNGSMEVTWNLANITLPPGEYTAELLPTGAASTAGENPLARSHAFSFHIQPGDGNGDRSVNFVDFGILSVNFGQTVGPLGPGDLDGSGIVNFTDFGFLSANFGVFSTPLLLDFGDAPPETSYPTTLAADGARHVVSSLILGPTVDGEANGQPSPNATGDDDAGDDEDGVTFGTLQAGANATVTVTASAVGVLNAWLDFNADGDWADDGEQVFVDRALAAGVNELAIAVPAGATVGATVARFRLTSAAGYSFIGLAPDGEVEDHRLTIVAASSSAPSRASFLSPLRATNIAADAATKPSRSSVRATTTSVVEPVPSRVVDLAVLEVASERRSSQRAADSLRPLDEYLLDDVIGEPLL